MRRHIYEMDWTDHIEQLEKNLGRYRIDEWSRRYLSINRSLIEDILWCLRSNNCRIWIFRNPVSYMDGVMYNAMTQKFETIEKVIDCFSEFYDCDIGIFQIFGHKIISPEFFEPRTAVMVRYATNFYQKPDIHTQHDMQMGISPRPFEFIKIEEMTI